MFLNFDGRRTWSAIVLICNQFINKHRRPCEFNCKSSRHHTLLRHFYCRSSGHTNDANARAHGNYTCIWKQIGGAESKTHCKCTGRVIKHNGERERLVQHPFHNSKKTRTNGNNECKLHIIMQLYVQTLKTNGHVESKTQCATHRKY